VVDICDCHRIILYLGLQQFRLVTCCCLSEHSRDSDECRWGAQSGYMGWAW
jgi:hypothetical protein